jgi:hypothetical protein
VTCAGTAQRHSRTTVAPPATGRRRLQGEKLLKNNADHEQAKANAAFTPP